ncbi:MAG: DUF3782 domain-containing protein, partial [Planctomycetes bacterium]|nr:DUF3782 domain-containing protein [Planctomycetota bacterium]
MNREELKKALLELANEPAVRDELRRSLSVIEIDPTAVLERIDRNTESLRELREDFQALHEDFQREIVALRMDFQAGMATLRKELQDEIVALRKDFQAGMATLRKEFQDEIVALRKEFQEGMAAFREEMAALKREMLILSRAVSAGQLRMDALGARWGIRSEESFREGM